MRKIKNPLDRYISVFYLLQTDRGNTATYIHFFARTLDMIQI